MKIEEIAEEKTKLYEENFAKYQGQLLGKYNELKGKMEGHFNSVFKKMQADTRKEFENMQQKFAKKEQELDAAFKKCKKLYFFILRLSNQATRRQGTGGGSIPLPLFEQ